MKKLLLIPILTVIGFTAFSQGDIKNASYVNVSWNKPIMNYGERTERSSYPDNLYNWYRTDKSDFQHMGGSLEFGTNFYIHPTGFVEGFKAGVLVDFIDLGVNYMSFQDSTIKLQNPTNESALISCTDLTARYSLNIGLILTFSPAKNFFVDVFGKFRPTFAVNYMKVPMFEDNTDPKDKVFYDKIYANDAEAIYNDAGNPLYHKPNREDTGTGFGLNSSFGFNIRYSKVTLGMEWVMGKINYTYNDFKMDQTVYDQYFKVKLGMFFVDGK